MAPDQKAESDDESQDGGFIRRANWRAACASAGQGDVIEIAIWTIDYRSRIAVIGNSIAIRIGGQGLQIIVASFDRIGRSIIVAIGIERVDGIVFIRICRHIYVASESIEAAAIVFGACFGAIVD
jgi:hypothetical protein